MAKHNPHYSSECDAGKYAFCGKGTCEVIDGTIAVCGCELKTGITGTFEISKASAILIQSESYRRALGLFISGASELGQEVICKAIVSGDMYTEAGYNLTLSSYYDSASTGLFFSSKEDSSTVLSSISSSAGTECMGAPCTAVEFADGCDVRCICGVDISANSTSSGSCVRVDETKSTWETERELMKLIEDTKAFEDELSDYSVSDTCSACSVAKEAR